MFWHVAIRGKIWPLLQPKCQCSSTKIFSQQRHLSHIPNLSGHLHRTPVTDRTFNFTLSPFSLKRCTFQLNGFKIKCDGDILPTMMTMLALGPNLCGEQRPRCYQKEAGEGEMRCDEEPGSYQVKEPVSWLPNKRSDI